MPITEHVALQHAISFAAPARLDMSPILLSPDGSIFSGHLHMNISSRPCYQTSCCQKNP